MNEFRPLGLVGVDHDALIEGVPEWLRASLLDWAQSQYRFFRSNSRGHGGTYVWRHELFRETERRLHVRLATDATLSDGGSAWRAITQLAEESQEHFLEVINFLLFEMGDEYGSDREAEELKEILEEGGSAWTVRQRDGAYRLERRADDTVVAAAEMAMSAPGSAGSLLASAWGRAYGRHPDPGQAYGNAIKAVEAAAVGVISPNNARATLGTMIKDIEAAPHKWVFALTTAPHVDPVGTVTNMMQCLWTGQAGRHGSAAAIHVDNTQREAEVALSLAIPLIQWFSDGAIRRV